MESRAVDYRVVVDFSPAYEMVASFAALTEKQLSRPATDLGQAWRDRVTGILRPDFAAELPSQRDLCVHHIVFPFIYECPGERGCWGFLRWFNTLAPAELRSVLARYGVERFERDEQLLKVRDAYVRLLREWNNQYFRRIKPDILNALAAEAAYRRTILETQGPEMAVETATGGILLHPDALYDLVVLVPQYHFKPINFMSWQGSTAFIMYPCETTAVATGQPSPSLLRIGRALGDSVRLQMLRRMSRGLCTLDDLESDLGLTRSVVHHHIVILRSAGLVRIYTGASVPDQFGARLEALDTFAGKLRDFLEQDEKADARSG